MCPWTPHESAWSDNRNDRKRQWKYIKYLLYKLIKMLYFCIIYEQYTFMCNYINIDFFVNTVNLRTPVFVYSSQTFLDYH